MDRTPFPRSGMGSFVLASLAAAVLVAVGAPAAQARTVRVFSVGYRLEMADVVSYQTYRDKMFAMMDAAFPGRSALVQAGVDDVASHIKPNDAAAPDLVLVNFPEDTGLAAAFIGSRGAAARATDRSALAFLSLYQKYARPRGYYGGLLGLSSANIVELIGFAATDTFYRAFYETFRDIASTYGVYVTAGANMAEAVKVQQADDPALYDVLIDPDEAGVRDYFYKGVSPVLYNSTYLFTPDGEIFTQDADGTVKSSPSETGGVIKGTVNKVYLTPIELNLLQVADGRLSRFDVQNTPVGRLGFVISKDAWMTDINDRLAARHAHLLVQSEAFSSWAFQSDPWDPDIFKQGGYNNLQKHQSFLYNVAPSLTGNLTDITFDGQTAILERGHKGGAGPIDGSNAWIGQNADTGFVALAPWIRSDPGIANPGLTLAERRDQLVDDGVKLLPGSGVACAGPRDAGACENGYREAVVWTDVTLPDGVDVLGAADPTPPAPTLFGTSVQVSDDDDAMPSSQLYPQIATDGVDTLYVVWQDTRNGNDNVYASMSTDGGLTWSADVHVSDDSPGQNVELLPELAFTRDDRRAVSTVYVVWQRLGDGGNAADASIMLGRFDENLVKVGPDVRVDDSDGAGKWYPVVTTIKRAGRPVVVWVDQSERGPRVSDLERLYASRGRGRRTADGRPGVQFKRSREIVRKKDVVREAGQLANEWAPAITGSGREVFVSWLDFRSYNWDVYASYSKNGLRYPRFSTRVDDSTVFERLNSHPSIARDDVSGRVLLVWADQRERQVDTNVFVSTSPDGRSAWSQPQRLDSADLALDVDHDVPSNQWQPEISASSGRACVAWQDNRLGNNDIFAALSNDALTFGSDTRVDDSDDGSSEQFSPATAIAAGRCFVVWSDNRSGDFDIRIASTAF